MMATETNSIFNFATKELSQDAFFAWLLNGWNTPADQPHAEALKTTAYDFLKLLYGDNIPFSQDKIATLKVWMQQDKIDVLVDVKTTDQQQYYLIIEDKTNTSEHDKQITRYVDVLDQAVTKDEKDKPIKPRNPKIQQVAREYIHVAYVKVAYWNHGDQDVLTLPNTTGVDAEKLQRFLTPHQDEHFLIKDFLQTLIPRYINEREDAKQAAEAFNFEKKEPFKNAAEEFYLLEKVWSADSQSDKGRITQGTSSGRPWANYAIWNREVTIDDVEYNRSLFWRADSDSKGRYLCLRQYEWFNQKALAPNEGERKVKAEAFKELQDAVDLVSGKLTDYARESINNRSANGANLESTLVHLTLSNWSDFSELRATMTALADAAKAAANKYWVSKDGTTTIGDKK